MADTVNWNIPNIKAGKISATNNAYTNPQFPIADQFSVWGKVAENVGKSVALGMQQQQENVKRGKDEQIALLKRTNEERAIQYDEVAKISTIGGSDFEISKDQMLYDLKDKYVEIKMAMDDPNSGVDPVVAARALAEVNNSIAKYKTQAPLVLAAAVGLKEALAKGFGEAGAMASQTPTPQQEILLSLIGDGKVGIKDYQGEFYLYKQDEEFDPRGLSVFNIDSYMKETSNGEDPDNYFERIIDTTEMDKRAVGAFIKEGTGLPIAYFEPQEETTADGKKVVNFYNYKTDKSGNEIGKEALLNIMSKTGFNFIDNKDYAKDARNLYNDTAGFTGKQSGQDDVWNPNEKDADGNAIKREYKVKGYTKDGKFVFDPKGSEIQSMIDYTTGKPIKLTQDEFLKRFLAERALLDNGPKNLKTMTGISNAPETGGKGDGFSYLIDDNFAGDPLTAEVPNYLAGRGEESWFAVKTKKVDKKDKTGKTESGDDGKLVQVEEVLPRSEWSYQKKVEGKDVLDPKTAILIFNKNKKEELTYNRAGHHQISNKTKSKQQN